jgi:hypothetical protein
MTQKAFLLLILVFFSTQSINAQLGFSHEIGAIMGPVAFQSDYGVRSDFETNSGNTGFGAGIVHYINFAYRADCNCYTRDKFFNDHFKIRNEISYSKTFLEHLGQWVDEEKTSAVARRLRGMTAEANVLDIGSELEFYPYSIRDFAAGGYKFAPFFSLGIHFNSFAPKSAQDNSQISQLEFQQTSNVDPNVSIGGVNGMENNAIFLDESSTNEGFSSWSLVWSIGTRYKLTPLSDLMINLRWQYYGTDLADGLDHNAPSDKFNDWNAWLNFGYIYYLD